jgi:hypothetical protein
MEPRQVTSDPGGARASRANASPARTDGAPAVANFSETLSPDPTLGSDDCGEAPQSAREARTLPRKWYRFVQLIFAFWVAIFAACETANYVPPVAPEMTASPHGKRGAEVATLERGRSLFVHRCIECHTLPPIWKYSNEDWPKVVDDMSHRANLKPQDRDAVIAYILAARAGVR